MINILIFFLSFFHPYYISVTEIKHNNKSKSLEIASKIFFDDLEKQIEKDNKLQIDIIKPTNKEKVNLLIADYVKKHLQIKVDGKVLTMNYIGYEIQEDAAWCYFEIPKVSKVKVIEIKNDILYNLHQEQINMLNVVVDDKRQVTKLEAPVSKAVFKF